MRIYLVIIGDDKQGGRVTAGQGRARLQTAGGSGRVTQKFYDAKNYKKGLKNADKLLETHP